MTSCTLQLRYNLTKISFQDRHSNYFCVLLYIWHVGFHVFKMANPLAEGIWKLHIFRHLFVCFQTSVYSLGEFHKKRNNITVFEELSVSIVGLTVANIRFTAFATIKSTIDSSNSSNTVLLFLNYEVDKSEFVSQMRAIMYHMLGLVVGAPLKCKILKCLKKYFY